MFYEKLPCFREPGSTPAEGNPVGRSVFYCCDGHPDLTSVTMTCGVHLPFAASLPNALAPGRLISITGHIPSSAKQFTVALTCGVDADVALRVEVNLFPNSYVARNSRLAGKWGSEESAMGQRNRFHRDMKVHIDVLTLRSGFYVAVNGRHFVKYRHRVRISQVDTLRISGDLLVLGIAHAVATSYPAVCTDNPLPYDALVGTSEEGVGTDDAVARTIDKVDDGDRVEGEIVVPFIGKLTGGHLASGKELIVEGKVELLPCMLYVRLQKGPQHWPPPDVSLSVRARYMGTTSGEPELALCSRVASVWGAETLVPKYPFKPGTRFRLAVSVVGDHYQVLVNGKLLAHFQHTMPSEEMLLVDTVVIKGCVFVYHVYFNEKNSDVLR